MDVDSTGIGVGDTDKDISLWATDQSEQIAHLKGLQSEQRWQDGRIKEQLLSHICSYWRDVEKNLLQQIASRNPGGELDLLDTVVLLLSFQLVH